MAGKTKALMLERRIALSDERRRFAAKSPELMRSALGHQASVGPICTITDLSTTKKAMTGIFTA
ncbi:hypothetical protein DQ397_002593 [Pseudomonas sp. CK-NBRI-02]|uniref:hypothetical protein n=1 Tax=Pseudomonas sp. CK-NBRI-02 TaxID=2249759 RepID=UPI0011E67D31|nr:hypothetical protein [Pseudomonas sp. CK-NBRI-02]TYO75992.1 hypothetical protein DQ397_002593 [Pseudomonas sp. CK-NBRI-02]